jgi:hypothetical protein
VPVGPYSPTRGDTVYTEGAVGGETPAKNVQTTLIPAGGVAKDAGAGTGVLAGRSQHRAAMEKGALGVLEVAGAEQPGIFKTLVPGTHGTGTRQLSPSSPTRGRGLRGDR